MKRFSKFFAAVLLSVALVFCIAACNNGNDVALKGRATVIIHGETDVVYDVELKDTNFTTQNTVLDLLGYLTENGTPKLTFNATASGTSFGYSAFINSIGALEPVGNQYVAFFHNKQSDKDVSGYVDDITYEGQTLYFSGLGVGSVKLVDGLKVYFTILSY